MILLLYWISDRDMQVLHVPGKSDNYKQGTTLIPASCASGLALMVGDGKISDLSLTALVERINRIQGNNRRQNLSLQNEDWSNFHWNYLRFSHDSLFLGD